MLTDSELKHLKPKAKPYKVSDRDGMYVLVSPGGTISFRVDYRLNGRRETVTLGKYAPSDLSLARAREKCIDAKRLIAEGQSPAIEKQREKRRIKEAKSFGQFGEKWLQMAPMFTQVEPATAETGHPTTLRPAIEIRDHSPLGFGCEIDDDRSLRLMVDEPHRREKLAIPLRISALDFIRPDLNRPRRSTPFESRCQRSLEICQKGIWLQQAQRAFGRLRSAASDTSPC